MQGGKKTKRSVFIDDIADVDDDEEEEEEEVGVRTISNCRLRWTCTEQIIFSTCRRKLRT